MAIATDPDPDNAAEIASAWADADRAVAKLMRALTGYPNDQSAVAMARAQIGHAAMLPLLREVNDKIGGDAAEHAKQRREGAQ